MTKSEAINRLKSCLDCPDCYTCADHDKAIEVLLESYLKVLESPWISVKERLPEDNGRLQVFLVCRAQPSAAQGGVSIKTEYFTNKFDGKDNITHWMPLPEPPKEDWQ